MVAILPRWFKLGGWVFTPLRPNHLLAAWTMYSAPWSEQIGSWGAGKAKRSVGVNTNS